MATKRLDYPKDLSALQQEAVDLLVAVQNGEPEAVAQFIEVNGGPSDVERIDLSTARVTLAKLYGLDSWKRLLQACRMLMALHQNDVATVRRLIDENPALLNENAQPCNDNWGPPMSYAANLGHDDLISMLFELGAKDLQHAFDRACLQGRIETARRLVSYGAKVSRGIVMGSCETVNADGLRLLLELGAELCDGNGDTNAPLGMIMQTYWRNPDGKHGCLRLLEERGVQFPDTAIMAFHRGRLDLLQKHVESNPEIIHQRFTVRDIFPPEACCIGDGIYGIHGTALDGTTLLHMCVDFDEMKIAEWLLQNGADANAAANVDDDGFGGHTPVFNAVVSQANACGRQRDAAMAKLLLDHGADPKVRASLRKALLYHEDESVHEFRGVAPVDYGEQFHDQRFVNSAVIELLRQHGG